MNIYFVYGTHWSRKDTLKYCEAVLEDDIGNALGKGSYVCTFEKFEKPKARKLAFIDLIRQLDESLRFDAWDAYREREQ